MIIITLSLLEWLQFQKSKFLKSLILHETIHSEFKSLNFSIQIQNFSTLIHYYTFIKKEKKKRIAYSKIEKHYTTKCTWSVNQRERLKVRSRFSVNAREPTWGGQRRCDRTFSASGWPEGDGLSTRML